MTSYIQFTIHVKSYLARKFYILQIKMEKVGCKLVDVTKKGCWKFFHKKVHSDYGLIPKISYFIVIKPSISILFPKKKKPSDFV